MSTRISDMKNLGTATERMLMEVDIQSAEHLRSLGAVEAYQRLKFRFGQHVTLIALYAMEAAIRNCDWRTLDTQTKEYLRQQAQVTKR